MTGNVRWLWVFVAVGCSGGTPEGEGEAPEVSSVEPADGAVGVSRETRVVVRFSEPIDPDAGTITVSPSTWTASFDGSGETLTLTADGLLGSLVDHELRLEGLVDEDGLPLGTFTARFQTELADRVEARPPSGEGGPWHFAEVGLDAGLVHVHTFGTDTLNNRPMTGGGALGDYDGDEFPDFFMGNGTQSLTRLYHNRRDGTFADVGAEAGVALDDAVVSAPLFYDADYDHDLDLLMATFEGQPYRIFLNQADGTFVDGGDFGIDNGGRKTYSSALGDIDGDGDLDLALSRWDVVDPEDPRFLFRNEGDHFVEGTTDAWLYTVDMKQTYTPNFADMDDDGYPELLFAGDHETSAYLRNNGDGTFLRDLEVELVDENGMGATVGDYDNDGDLDWYVSSILDPNGVADFTWGVTGNVLYENQGPDGHLVAVTEVADVAGTPDGSWGWGACFADLDLDGYLDLFHVNGWNDDLGRDIALEEYGKNRSPLYVNNGDGTFREIGLELGVVDRAQGRGLGCVDYDRDGDIDLLVINVGERPLLYRNDTDGSAHFFNVRLDGVGANTEAVGARVYVTTGDTTQMRELRLGSNYAMADPVEAHFGLGAAATIDELRVVWPDGTETVTTDVAADRFVLVSQPGAPARPDLDLAPGEAPEPYVPTTFTGELASVSVGTRNSCGPMVGGGVACWGHDFFDVNTDAPAEAYDQVVVGADFACGLAEGSDAVTCWGEDMHEIVSEAPDRDAWALTAGSTHACAVLLDGDVRCWGSSLLGKTTIPPIPGAFLQLDAGHQHTCGVIFDGRLACFGEPGPWRDEANEAGGTWSKVSAGDSVTCAIAASDGSLTCWGDETDGRSSPPPGTGFVDVKLGTGATGCALNGAGELHCWGDNGSGQATPPQLDGWVAFDVGRDAVCGITDDGDTLCWGDNAYAQCEAPPR